MALFFRIIRHLLPQGLAWRITAALRKRVEQLFAALAQVLADAREYADLAARDLFVDDTRLLTQHQQQFGLEPNGTDEQQRAAVAAAWAATGGQSPQYIQGILRAAGFDLYVHEWWGSGTPARLLGDLTRGWWAFDTARVTLVGGEVDSVEDLSGAGHPLAAPSSDARLTFLENAGPGGRRTVGAATDAANDVMQALELTFAEGERPGMGAVLRLQAVPISDQSLVSLVGPGGTYWRLRAVVGSPGNFVFTVHYEGGSSADVVGPELDTDWHLFEFYMLEDGWLFFVDGVEHASGRTEGVSDRADGGDSALFAPMVGSALELQEIVLFEGEPIAEQRSGLRNHLAWRNRGLGIEVTPRDPRDYTSQPKIGTVQCDEPDALCGEPTALCDGLLGNEIGYLVNQAGTANAPPGIPDDASPWEHWPYFIYIGAARFPDRVYVSPTRRAELERLVLRLCPDQHWIVMGVIYEDLEPLDTEAGPHFAAEDGETMYVE